MATDTLDRIATDAEARLAVLRSELADAPAGSWLASDLSRAIADTEETIVALSCDVVKVGECDRCLAVDVLVTPDAETGGWSCSTRC